jgi:hypothetical protein
MVVAKDTGHQGWGKNPGWNLTSTSTPVDKKYISQTKTCKKVTFCKQWDGFSRTLM